MADIVLTPGLVIAAGAVFPPLCTIVAGLRFYTRRVQGHRLGADDWLIVPAVFLVIGMGAAVLAGVALKSLAYPTPPAPSPTEASFEQQTTRKILWAVELLQIPALACVKLSFLFFYRRIFSTGQSKIFNAFTVAMMVLIGAWAVAFFFAFLFICGTRFDPYWVSLSLQRLYCVDTVMLHNAFSISDVITDIIIILIPLPLIWNLHLTLGRKFAVSGIFGLGALAVAASIARMIVFVESTARLHKGVDIGLLTTGGIYWSMLESGIGLIAASLPTMYGLFKSKSLATIVQGVRSITSLHSSSSSKEREEAEPQFSTSESGSDRHILAERDIEDRQSKESKNQNQIWVSNSITSAENMA